MQRICPVCQEKLTTNDHYFCGNCGGILESSLILKIDSSKKVVDMDKVTTKKSISPSKIKNIAVDFVKLTNIKGIIILLGLLAFVGIPLYVFMTGLQSNLNYMILASKAPKKSINAPLRVQTKETSATPQAAVLPLVPDILGDQDLIKFVPYNSDIFVESADAISLFKMLAVKDTYYTELYESLATNINGRTVAFMDDRTEGKIWVVVLQRKSAEDFKYTVPAKYNWIYSKQTDNKILLSNSQTLLESAISAGSNLEKNINLNPTFVPFRNRISVTAKLAIVTLTGDGKKILSSQIPVEIPDEIKTLLMDAFSKENNFLVIR